jgi:hypothetical protein
VRLRGVRWGWATAPDGGQVAIALGWRARLQLAATRPLRSRGSVPLGANQVNVPAVAWPAPDRILALVSPFGGPAVVADVDPVARRVRSRRALGGAVVAAEGGRDALVAVLGPVDAIGQATLVAVGADGAVRRWALPGISAGSERPGDDHRVPARQETPGLALDESTGRAYIAAPNAGRIAAVDMSSGEVAVHDIARGRSPFAVLRDLIEPPAEAKVFEGAQRLATYLGGGRLAVWGEDFDARGRIEQIGLRIVDTASWTEQIVDRDATSVYIAAGRLVVANPGARAGVFAYDAAGRPRWHGLARRAAFVHSIARDRVYAVDMRRRRTTVLDLASGRIEHVVRSRRVPHLLER